MPNHTFPGEQSVLKIAWKYYIKRLDYFFDASITYSILLAIHWSFPMSHLSPLTRT
jgi:hypothetical protein